MHQYQRPIINLKFSELSSLNCSTYLKLYDQFTLKTSNPRCSFPAKITISIRDMIMSWNGVVTPKTAPNEMRTVAEAKSAFNKLLENYFDTHFAINTWFNRLQIGSKYKKVSYLVMLTWMELEPSSPWKNPWHRVAHWSIIDAMRKLRATAL